MLEHLRHRIIDLLEQSEVVTLSTYGPAGIQAQVLPYTSRGLWLYILVPVTSDHLFNLEWGNTIVATTLEWQLFGQARQLPPTEVPTDVQALEKIKTGSYSIVEVRPSRMQIGLPNGRGFSETIDVDDEGTLEENPTSA